MALGRNSFNGAIPDVFASLHNLSKFLFMVDSACHDYPKQELTTVILPPVPTAEIRLQKNRLEYELPVSLGMLTTLRTIVSVLRFFRLSD